MPVKIVVAEDQHVLRKACVLALQMRPDFEVCAQAANGQEALTALKYHRPDILLLDLNMPVMDGFAVLETLQKEKAEVKTIVVSMIDDPRYIARCMQLGARGYLCESNPNDLQEQAIDSVLQSGYYFNDQTNHALLQDIKHLKKFEPHFSSISVHFNEDEMKVLDAFCRQLTARETGKELCISKRTIDRWKMEMTAKINAKNFMSVAIYAHQNGLIDLTLYEIRKRTE